jgi:hypothetical protein
MASTWKSSLKEVDPAKAAHVWWRGAEGARLEGPGVDPALLE